MLTEVLLAAHASGTAPAVGSVATSGSTAFARLSPAAQDLIVNAVMGEYEKFGPPDIAESVKAEIAAWAQEDESPNVEISSATKGSPHTPDGSSSRVAL